MAELVALVQDTVYVTTQSLLGTVLPDDFESLGVFTKVAEEARRHRTLMLESGDESARLKIQTQWQGQQNNQGGGDRKWDKGNKSDNWASNKWDQGNKWDNKSE